LVRFFHKINVFQSFLKKASPKTSLCFLDVSEQTFQTSSPEGQHMAGAATPFTQ